MPLLIQESDLECRGYHRDSCFKRVFKGGRGAGDGIWLASENRAVQAGSVQQPDNRLEHSSEELLIVGCNVQTDQ